MLRELHAARVPHLPVRVRDGAGSGRAAGDPRRDQLPGAARTCTAATATRRWPAVAAQLRDTVGSADRATVLATAALALNQVDRVIAAVRGGVDSIARRSRRRRWTPRWSSTSTPARSWPAGGRGIRGARADIACCQSCRALRSSWMMVGWQTSNAAAPRATPSWRALPVGMAGRAALGFGKRLTGKSKDEVNAELMDKAAQQLFTVLGELKGGAMKVGQALSVMEAAIPEQYGKPYREALTKLQRDAPPLPAAKVHRVLDAPAGHQVARAVRVVRRHARSRRPASARCTRRCGPTAARSRSRSSTRAPTRRCAPT